MDMTKMRWDRAGRPQPRQLVDPPGEAFSLADTELREVSERMPLPSGGWVQLRVDRRTGAYRVGLRFPRCRNERRTGDPDRRTPAVLVG
jgi:hypothetical protein